MIIIKQLIDIYFIIVIIFYFYLKWNIYKFLKRSGNKLVTVDDVKLKILFSFLFPIILYKFAKSSIEKE